MPAEGAIVVGAGLGGLSAAIHLRLAGYDVTVLESNAQVGGRANQIKACGFTFDVGPSLLNYPWVFEELFAAAGRRLSDYVTLMPVDPSVRFEWPDGTHLQLTSDMRQLLAELERLEPGCRPRALDFLADAGAKYRLAFDTLVTRNEDSYVRWIRNAGIRSLASLGIHRSLDAELSRFFRNRYIREALGSYGMYLGGSPYDLPGMFSILAYGELAYGLWLPRGGVYGLVEGIARLAAELGVVLRTNARVTRILTAGAVTGVELASGERLDARTVVSNVDVPTTHAELLSKASLRSAASRRASGARMTPGVITFYWGLRGPVEGIGHHTIFFPSDVRATYECLFNARRMPDEPAFYVSVPSATDISLAPPGDSAVFVLVPAPLLSQMPDADWKSVVNDVRSKVLQRLADRGVVITADRLRFEEVYTPADWRARFGLYDGSAFGAAHTLFQLGPWRAPNTNADVPGLFYVGASTTPGTGMPMVVLGGRMVVERITGERHKKAAIATAGAR